MSEASILLAVSTELFEPTLAGTATLSAVLNEVVTKRRVSILVCRGDERPPVTSYPGLLGIRDYDAVPVDPGCGGVAAEIVGEPISGETDRYSQSKDNSSS